MSMHLVETVQDGCVGEGTLERIMHLPTSIAPILANGEDTARCSVWLLTV